jgi:hypothetical protein
VAPCCLAGPACQDPNLVCNPGHGYCR